MLTIRAMADGKGYSSRHLERRDYYAEGGEDEVGLTFSTHDVIVTGNHLSQLIADMSNQHLSALRQPVRAEMFGVTNAVRVAGITVRKVE